MGNHRFLERAHLPVRRDDPIALPLRSAGKSASAHRLAVQDVALSRRKQGFDSPWARQPFQALSAASTGPCPRFGQYIWVLFYGQWWTRWGYFALPDSPAHQKKRPA